MRPADSLTPKGSSNWNAGQVAEWAYAHCSSGKGPVLIEAWEAEPMHVYTVLALTACTHACMQMCVQMCMHVYMVTGLYRHTCIRSYMQTFMHACRYAFSPACIPAYIQTSIHADLHICRPAHTHARTPPPPHAHMHFRYATLYLCMPVSMHVCACVRNVRI